MKKSFIAMLIIISTNAVSQEKLSYLDVFQLEWISDPQISLDGQRIIYVRNYNDIKMDQAYSNLWIVNFDGSNNHPLTTGNHTDFSPQWSPDGKKILYKSNKDGSAQLYLRWLEMLTAWIIGHTNRFKAAVVAKPIVNWYSSTLYSDEPAYYNKYWFPGFPWDNVEFYMKLSPISYVNNVKTPAMLLTGENDYRTPIAEIEQYYAALKLNKVETAMVRIQESGHGIADRPSNEIYKVAYTLGWFEKFRSK